MLVLWDRAWNMERWFGILDTKKYIKHLERVQQRAIKLVPELRELSYEERLRNWEIWIFLHLNTGGCKAMSLKLTNKYIQSIWLTMSCRHWHIRTVWKPVENAWSLGRECSTSLRLNFFSFRILNIWNCLPQDIVMASSVNCLKGRLDRHWRNIMYSTDIGRYFKF